MLYTANLNLKKPELTDYVDIRILNENTDAIDIAIAGKVDVVAGKQLSTEDYTTVEKTKLTGIETGATADQTGSEIKTLYEGNTNTNAYTDAEQTKLAGIATGAQVNAVTSVNTRTGAVVVTKTDVGLSAVLNYGIATTAESQAGTSDVKYMTPLKAKQSVFANAPLINPRRDSAGAIVYGAVISSRYADATTSINTSSTLYVNGSTIATNITNKHFLNITYEIEPNTTYSANHNVTVRLRDTISGVVLSQTAQSVADNQSRIKTIIYDNSKGTLPSQISLEFAVGQTTNSETTSVTIRKVYVYGNDVYSAV